MWWDSQTETVAVMTGLNTVEWSGKADARLSAAAAAAVLLLGSQQQKSADVLGSSQM